MAVENTPLEGVHHWRACAFSILHPHTSRPEHLTEAFLNAINGRNCRTGVLDAQRSSLVKLLDTFLSKGGRIKETLTLAPPAMLRIVYHEADQLFMAEYGLVLAEIDMSMETFWLQRSKDHIMQHLSRQLSLSSGLSSGAGKFNGRL
jgi:hypothetical protein